MSKPELICVGAIAGAFGVQGEVRLKSFCAEPEAHRRAMRRSVTEDGARSFTVKLTRPVAGGFGARLGGHRHQRTGRCAEGRDASTPRRPSCRRCPMTSSTTPT